ncbi:MAG: DsrE family protein [bacterium]|nr:DsrE family protein [bacterium]
MKLAIIISTKEAEIVWNALRLANFAVKEGDDVTVFLIGPGVDYEEGNNATFTIRDQTTQFLQNKGKMQACGTCVKMRQKEETATCPISSMSELYGLIKTSDKIITF